MMICVDIYPCVLLCVFAPVCLCVCSTLRLDVQHRGWDHIFQLLAVMEDFIYYTPLPSAVAPTGHGITPMLARPSSAFDLAHGNSSVSMVGQGSIIHVSSAAR